MTKKSAKRMAQRAEDIRNKKVMYALETMGAAYCKMTNILPTEACLRIKPDETTGELKYWFEHHGPQINDSTAHPHVKYLLSAVYALVEANKTKNTEVLETILLELQDFLQDYADINS